SLALEKLRDYKLIYVPKDLSFSFEKFNNEALFDSISRLNVTKEKIEEAKTYFEYGEFEKAYDSLRYAKIELFKTRKIVELTIEELEKKIAIPLPREVVYGIIERYEKEIEDLEKAREMKRTYIELYLNGSEFWVGESFEIFGKLYSDKALPNRNVTVFFESQRFVLRTDEKGEFSLTLRVPYVYKEKTKVEAFFYQEGDYSAAKNSTEIKIKFLEPRIEIELNKKEFLPGEVVKVKAITDQEAEIEFLGEKEISNYAEFVIPLNESEGEKRVIVRTNPKGIIAPGFASESIYVYRKDVSVQLDFPFIVFSGTGFDLVGKINESLNGVAIIKFGDKVYDGMIEDGKFSVRVQAPFSQSSKEKVVVSLDFEDKRYRSVQKEAEIVLINPIVFAPFFALLYYATRKRKTDTFVEEKVEIIEEKEKSPYLECAEIIARMSGVEILKSDTIREYLSKVRGKINEELFSKFENLSYIYEEHVYAGRELKKEFYEILEEIRCVKKS
ncbi:MAG: hypothetical protein ACK401_08050, partial [Archaeoglobaceae archaeon]